MAFGLEIEEMFDVDDGLADDAVYDDLTRKRTIKVILTSAFYEAAGVESSSPAAVCIASDVSGARHGHKLTVSGITYTVVGVQLDDRSLTATLILERPDG